MKSIPMIRLFLLLFLWLGFSSGVWAQTEPAMTEAELELAGGIMAGMMMVFGLIYLAIIIVMIVSIWKIFTKAGEPGWISIIPLYNTWKLCEVSGKPGWWLFLLCIPLVNIVIGIMVIIGLAKKFSKGGGFIAGLILLPLIFYPILAFGKSKHEDGPGTLELGGDASPADSDATPNQPKPRTTVAKAPGAKASNGTVITLAVLAFLALASVGAVVYMQWTEISHYSGKDGTTSLWDPSQPAP